MPNKKQLLFKDVKIDQNFMVIMPDSNNDWKPTYYRKIASSLAIRTDNYVSVFYDTDNIKHIGKVVPSTPLCNVSSNKNVVLLRSSNGYWVEQPVADAKLEVETDSSLSVSTPCFVVYNK